MRRATLTVLVASPFVGCAPHAGEDVAVLGVYSHREPGSGAGLALMLDEHGTGVSLRHSECPLEDAGSSLSWVRGDDGLIHVSPDGSFYSGSAFSRIVFSPGKCADESAYVNTKGRTENSILTLYKVRVDCSVPQSGGDAEVRWWPSVDCE